MYIFLLPCNNKLKSELTEEDRHDASLEEDDLAVSTGSAADGIGGVNSPAAWSATLQYTVASGVFESECRFADRVNCRRMIKSEQESLPLNSDALIVPWMTFGYPR